MPGLDTIDLPIIQGVVSNSDARAVVARALIALASGRATMPGALSLEIDAGEVHVKGAYLAGSTYMGFKVSSGFPGNYALSLPTDDGFSVALDASTGQPAALLLDQGWLTQMRTAAAGALAAELLARPDATSVAIVGAGGQAAFQLDALRQVRDIRDVRVWNRSPERASEFAVQQTRPGSLVQAVGTVEAAVRDADIVVTVTSSREPIVEGDWLAPGTHITAVGADAVGKRELASSVLSKADVLVADLVRVCREVGELQYLPDTENTPTRVVEFADIVAGVVAGRQTADQITLIDQCGLGVYDAAMVDFVMSNRAPGS